MSKNKCGALFGFLLTRMAVMSAFLLKNGFICCFVKQVDMANKVMQREVDNMLILL